MKKTFIISAMAIAALTACSVDESSVIGDGNTRTITFRGTAFPDTRTSIGSPENGSYPVLWTRGDQIGIYGMLGGFLNVPATLNDSDAGMNSGVFVLNTTEQTAAEGGPVLVVPHGVARAAFSTWAHAKEENSNVIELCMHHSIDRRYKGAYNRAKMLEQKRALLEAWGEFCCSEI